VSHMGICHSKKDETRLIKRRPVFDQVTKHKEGVVHPVEESIQPAEEEKAQDIATRMRKLVKKC